MTCERARELAALAASADLAPAERQALDLHNAVCAACRAEAEGFEDLLAQLTAMRDETFPNSAGAAVRARVAAKIDGRRKPGWLAWPAFAAVLACSAILVVLLRPEAPVPLPAAPAPPPAVAIARESKPAKAPEPVKPVRAHRLSHSGPVEPMVVHMFTSDPDVVVYWIADTNRKSSETGAM